MCMCVCICLSSKLCGCVYIYIFSRHITNTNMCVCVYIYILSRHITNTNITSFCKLINFCIKSLKLLFQICDTFVLVPIFLGFQVSPKATEAPLMFGGQSGCRHVMQELLRPLFIQHLVRNTYHCFTQTQKTPFEPSLPPNYKNSKQLLLLRPSMPL